MEFMIIAISGITGTILMTIFMKIASVVSGYHLHVPQILGTLITMDTQPSGKVSNKTKVLALGYVLHFAMGILFAITYLQLWQNGIGAPTGGYAFLFGLINGIFAVVIWYMLIKLHPLAPSIRLPVFLFCILIAHIIYAYGVVYTYRWIQ